MNGTSGLRTEGARLARARRAAFFWGLFLLALTSWPSPPHVDGISTIPQIDLRIHSFLYAVEGLLLYRAIRWPGVARFSLMRVLTVAGALAVLGTADEVHQSWIPGRSMEGSDLVSDILGGAVGAAVASAVSGRTHRGPVGRGRPGGPSPDRG